MQHTWFVYFDRNVEVTLEKHFYILHDKTRYLKTEHKKTSDVLTTKVHFFCMLVCLRIADVIRRLNTRKINKKTHRQRLTFHD